MRLDLHVHTTASDGSLSPGAVVDRAIAGGLHVIAIADHDTAAGSRAARASLGAHRREGGGRPIQVVPAVELSTTRAGEELHILGYFLDLDAPALRAHEERSGRRRRERLREIVGRLAAQGVEVEFEEVLRVAGSEVDSLGRPHLARALVQAGYASTISEAFDRLIGDHAPAFVPTDLLDPAAGVRVILESGGIAVWAHPPMQTVEELLPDLVADGLGGLEVYRPFSGPDQIRRLETLAGRHDLLLSGGSDFHDPDRGGLGAFYVTDREVGALLEAGGL